jgi:uncharacterized protein YbcC (UPF0753/DUF2309 family)
MGLDRGTGALVLLVGHGSQSANNAQAAALDCGACCGQTGEVSVRALARLLNEPEVRQAWPSVACRWASTRFVAALHNTATDEMVWFDLDQLPAATRPRWRRCRRPSSTRPTRCAASGRPRWACRPRCRPRPCSARCAGAPTTAPRPARMGPERQRRLVIAPRHRTRGVVLDGRVFLHDYDAGTDPEGQLLTQLMTAPMLVAHWINWQYHASVCEPERLGSGNKLLHNVVGGRIGVFEGNGGDLRIGLARQSVHDGQRWVHEPLRLTVVIDAPAAAIERVMATQEVVRQLVERLAAPVALWRDRGWTLPGGPMAGRAGGGAGMSDYQGQRVVLLTQHEKRWWRRAGFGAGLPGGTGGGLLTPTSWAPSPASSPAPAPSWRPHAARRASA